MFAFSLQTSLQYLPHGPPLVTVHEHDGCAHFSASAIRTLPATNLRLVARRSNPNSNLGRGALLAAFFPDLTEVNDDLDGLVHVLDRYPLEARVKVLLAGEEIGRQQAH